MSKYQRHYSEQNLWDKIWRDRQGRVVIWQFPNVPLLAWAGFTFLSLLFSGRLSDILSWIGTASLIIWSLLEVFKGSNYFRRLLGIAIFGFSIATLIKSL